MNINIHAGDYLIIARDELHFLAIALTHPGTPRVKIAINDISDKWDVGEKVLFRADYNSNDEIFVPVGRAEIDYSP